MTPLAKRLMLALLLLLGASYSLTAAYPIRLERFAPASSALQAMHILDGWRPIFYSGQSWMGPAGAYLLAGAHKLFDIDTALVTAALCAVPIDYLMRCSGQPRAHYTIIFVLVPLLFLATLALLRRHRAGRSVAAAA